MTDELTKEIIVGTVAAIATAVFSGIPAAVLVWWTWKRDQEKLIVQKVISPLTGEDEQRPSDVKVRVINRSLFTVNVADMWFEIDGQEYRPTRKYFPTNAEGQAYRQAAVGDSLDVEILGQDFRNFRSAIYAAARKHKCTVDTLVQSSKVVAIVALETNKIFRSELPLWLRTWRRLRQIKREMDGAAERYPDLG
jgi:hypothetical protein